MRAAFLNDQRRTLETAANSLSVLRYMRGFKRISQMRCSVNGGLVRGSRQEPRGTWECTEVELELWRRNHGGKNMPRAPFKVFQSAAHARQARDKWLAIDGWTRARARLELGEYLSNECVDVNFLCVFGSRVSTSVIAPRKTPRRAALEPRTTRTRSDSMRPPRE